MFICVMAIPRTATSQVITSGLQCCAGCFCTLTGLQKQADMGSNSGSVIYQLCDLNALYTVSDLSLMKYLFLKVAVRFGNSIFIASGKHSAGDC